MKKSKLFILAIIILISLTGCIQKIETEETIKLYPAFEIQNNKKIWGYINDKGDFKVQPKYEQTFDFSNVGLAKVKSDNAFGVIDSKGKEILSPVYQFVSDFVNGYFHAFDGKYSHLFNYKGEEQFFTDEFIFMRPYSDGLFTVAKFGVDDKPEFGYLNKTGKIIIESKFNEAWDFINGRALVKENDKYMFISTEGKVLEELPYELMAKIKNMDLYFFKMDDKIGVVDSNGNIKVQPKFANVNPEVDNEIIIVINDDVFGLIDINGNQILEMKYEDIKPLGEGYFAVKENGKYALLKTKGEIIFSTDFIYDNIGSNLNKIKSDLVSVYDGEYSYLIDLSGDKSNKGPELKGNADIYYDGYVSRVMSNNKLSYYSSEGGLIWEEKNFYQLNDNATVKEDILTNEEGLSIKYPVIEGLKDNSIEESINNRLYKEFVEDVKVEISESYKEYSYYNTSYSISKTNDLLTITRASEYLTKDDLYPTSTIKIYNINLNKGTFFTFKDLFKEDSDYIRIISDVIRGQAEQKNYDITNWNSIIGEIDFIAKTKTLDIYFSPGDIISYNEKFPKFTINQEEIEDILDYKSEFWWAFMVTRGF